ATGFLVERNQHTYLITNSHVVAGRRPDDGTITSPTGAVPDQVSIAHNQAGTLGACVWKAEPLYEAGGDPRWRQHPAHRRQVDVIALELPDLRDVDIHGHGPWAGPGLAFGVSRPVSIIGFPFGITGGGSMGVWAQGTVATEPEMDFNNLPCFLIDSRTRPG